MPLTTTKIRGAKPRDKPYKLADGRGLYLLVTPSGGKWWRWDYRFGGRRKTLSMGVFPDVELEDARNRRDAARKLVARKVDPAEVRRAEQVAAAGAECFEAVAREWHAKFKVKWTEGYADHAIRRLEQNVFPWLGKRAIVEIEPPEVLQVYRRIESRNAAYTAHRVHMLCSQVFRYAVATGRAQRDPTADLRGALTPVTHQRHAAITDSRDVGELLRAIDGFTGTYVVQAALRLAPLVFVRPKELRGAEWSEIDIDAKEWRIPAEKMKMRRIHIIPLSRQSMEILYDLQPVTGRSGFLFPSVRSLKRPMSENTINAALRRLGYSKEQMTGHGFRSMASTILHEQGWPSDVIERQLAHMEGNKVKAAYNHAQHLDERRKLMQSWADYLDGLKEGVNVVSIGRRFR